MPNIVELSSRWPISFLLEHSKVSKKLNTINGLIFSCKQNSTQILNFSPHLELVMSKNANVRKFFLIEGVIRQ